MKPRLHVVFIHHDFFSGHILENEVDDDIVETSKAIAPAQYFHKENFVSLIKKGTLIIYKFFNIFKKVFQFYVPGHIRKPVILLLKVMGCLYGKP